MSRDPEALIDIIEAIKLILQYSGGVSLEALAANRELIKRSPIYYHAALVPRLPIAV